MNFFELRIIVSQLKRTMRCSKCKGRYTDENIEVLGNLGFDETFFHTYCPTCKDEACIHVNLHVEPLPLRRGGVRLGTAPRLERITSNEVLDMHNYLKNFSGNFRDIFQEKNKKS